MRWAPIALLLRVCAYYHDVGKLVKPDYFVENQRNGNPHDSLAPSMSALVIQSHVKEGLELAREEKLPLPIRQGIATHHGTKLIRYFFNKATEREGSEKSQVRESDYRYPGPKPHTKELGILHVGRRGGSGGTHPGNPLSGKNSGNDRQDFLELHSRTVSSTIVTSLSRSSTRSRPPSSGCSRTCIITGSTILVSTSTGGKERRDSDPHQVGEKTVSADS